MGAWTNEGLYWIAPSGKTILVNKPDNHGYSMSHEEYANTKWNVSLEEALERKYVRLQSLPHQYLFIDHRQQHVKSNQEAPLMGFFFDKSMQAIPYSKFVIERPGGEHEFGPDTNADAFQFTLSGEIGKETQQDTDLGARNAANTAVRNMELSKVHPAYLRPGVSAFGDSTLSFGRWLKRDEFRKILG